MSRFIPYSREQQYLLPPSLNEWLPENHLARFIVEVVEGLDLSKLIGRYSGCGSAAYHPAMLLALLVYGYATGVFSSRKLERATYDSVAFRYIAAEQHPDHDTLANFRKTFLVELEDLFVQVLTVAQEMKLVKVVLIKDIHIFIDPKTSLRYPSHPVPRSTIHYYDPSQIHPHFTRRHTLVSLRMPLCSPSFPLRRGSILRQKLRSPPRLDRRAYSATCIGICD